MTFANSQCDIRACVCGNSAKLNSKYVIAFLLCCIRTHSKHTHAKQKKTKNKNTRTQSTSMMTDHSKRKKSGRKMGKCTRTTQQIWLIYYTNIHAHTGWENMNTSVSAIKCRNQSILKSNHSDEFPMKFQHSYHWATHLEKKKKNEGKIFGPWYPFWFVLWNN